MNRNDKARKILIITGGQIEVDFLRCQYAKENYTMIIAADHGLFAADQVQLPLDFIVGDFDSVPASILKKYQDLSTPIKTFPREKDKTDTQIALELALMHNPESIHIIGATGSRLDHVYANLHLLLLPMQLNIPTYIMDRCNKIYLQKDCFSIKKSEQFGDFVSLMPFSPQVSGLTLKGFKYPLHEIVLSAGSSLGISNEIEEEDAVVQLTDGILIVFETKD